MSAHEPSHGVCIAAVGALDARGLAGSALAPRDFGAGGLAALRWKTLFALPYPNYRHLDLFGRCICLATEAAGIARVLPQEQRRDTALVLATRLGCLQSDLDFAQSLQAGQRVSPAVFPYTLPSTCLGELAIRHRLQGPLLCLMPGAQDPRSGERIGLVEARRLVAGGEARAAVVCLGDCLTEERAREVDLPARVAVASVVLVRTEDLAPETRPPVELAALEAAEAPAEWLLSVLRFADSGGAPR
jgi:hypothetical protein